MIREGHGTGEGRGTSPGEVHDIALKAAETDGTKRALATFGKPFGLALYGSGKVSSSQKATAVAPAAPASLPTYPHRRFHPGRHHPDPTAVPLLRPSPGYGDPGSGAGNRQLGLRPSAGNFDRLPGLSRTVPRQIDKSALTIAEPKRLRDKDHLQFVRQQPCLICGRQPSDPHHLRFAQPRAIGLKVSDEFTVPLCRGHHRQLHQAGNEVAWWEDLEVNALEIAKGLWEQTHPKAQVRPQGSVHLPMTAAAKTEADS